MTHNLIRLSLGVLIALSTSSAFGWGTTGHRIIAEVIRQNISPQTADKLSDILDGESLEKASTWADNVKDTKTWSHTKPYHYKNIEDVPYLEDLAGLSAKSQKRGDVLTAILRAEDILRSATSNKASKKTALRFLLHFIGDIHQPLHVGRISDSGGNGISLYWFNYKTNLHSLWDTGMISRVIKMHPEMKKPFDPEAYVKILRKPSAKEIAGWSGKNPMDWYEESLGFRGLPYMGYKDENEDYLARYLPLVHDRILQAAFRTIDFIEHIFKQPLPVSQLNLRTEIRDILHDDSYHIQFTAKTTSGVLSRDAGDVGANENDVGCDEHSHNDETH